jgi:hypothetical protein
VALFAAMEELEQAPHDRALQARFLAASDRHRDASKRLRRAITRLTGRAVTKALGLG